MKDILQFGTISFFTIFYVFSTYVIYTLDAKDLLVNGTVDLEGLRGLPMNSIETGTFFLIAIVINLLGHGFLLLVERSDQSLLDIPRVQDTMQAIYKVFRKLQKPALILFLLITTVKVFRIHNAVYSLLVVVITLTFIVHTYFQENTTFRNAVFYNKYQRRGTLFHHCTFKDVSFENALLHYVHFDSCYFEENVDLQNASLRSTGFQESSLVGAKNLDLDSLCLMKSFFLVEKTRYPQYLIDTLIRRLERGENTCRYLLENGGMSDYKKLVEPYRKEEH